MTYLLQQLSSLLPRFELHLKIFTEWSMLELTSQLLFPVRYGGHCPRGDWPFPLCLNPFCTLLDTLQKRFHYALFLANTRCSGIGLGWFETSSEGYNYRNGDFWEANTAMHYRSGQPFSEKVSCFFYDALVINSSLDILLWNPNLSLQI